MPKVKKRSQINLTDFTEPQVEARQSDFQSKFLFFGIIALAATAGLGLINMLFIAWLALKEPPMLVRDKVEGTSFRVKAASDSVTEDEVLSYAVNCLSKIHTWTGLIPSSTHPGLMEADPGITISEGGTSNKLTTQAFEASFCLNPAIRVPIVQTIAEQTPQAIFSNDPKRVGAGTYVLFDARKWLGPEKQPDGRWKLTVIADITGFSPSHPAGKPISKFNKDIYIAESPQIPLLYQDVAYQRLAYASRIEGFEIDAITDTQIGGIRAPR